MQLLINHLEKKGKKYEQPGYLHSYISNALGKLRAYYKLLTASLVYYASFVLNPAMKLTHFNRTWAEGSDQQENWTEVKKDIWTIEYKDAVTLTTQSNSGERSAEH
jgi:hypothetical protein